MTRVQNSLATKIAAWALLLVSAFACAQFGLMAACSVPFTWWEDWQDTAAFSSMLRERETQLANYFFQQSLLQEFEGELSYMEQQQLSDFVQSSQAEMDSQATCFRFQICTQEGSDVLLSNLEEGTRLSEVVQAPQYALFSFQPISQLDPNLIWLSSSTQAEAYLYQCDYDISVLSTLDGSFLIMAYGVPSTPSDTVNDEFSALYQAYTAACQQYYPFIIAACVFGVLTLIALGILLWTSGHKAGQESIVLSWQERTFLELPILTTFCAIILLGYGALLIAETLTSRLSAYYYVGSSNSMANNPMPLIFLISLLLVAMVGTLALFLRTLAVRGKAGVLAQTTLLCRVVRWMVLTIREFVLTLPLTWRVIAGFLIYFYLDLVLFTQGRYNGAFSLLWIILNLFVLAGLCWWTVNFRRLRKGSQAIASGNLNHQIETQHMPRDLQRYAEDLNNISSGMANAVDEQMKSERFKAELITNVSHDLKTPLTSIINYVNLLKSTRQEDPKALEYIEVLDRKSQRLKKLTEDLVEASKASTGVLSVNREKISMSQLIDQALGEWTEKLEERKLTVVTTLPEGETWVYADGRHLWRVIDNLLSNCAKYAMEGTRVYLDLTRGKGQVSLSVKNISRDALNVPPERLLERFVRGEESRTTEGSGLGLSIARSLTELQGGTFSLTVDGDLFKATVSLPQAN